MNRLMLKVLILVIGSNWPAAFCQPVLPELEPPDLHEALDVGREGEAAGLLGVVKLEPLGRGRVGGRRVGGSPGGRQLPPDLGLHQVLKLGRIEERLRGGHRFWRGRKLGVGRQQNLGLSRGLWRRQVSGRHRSHQGDRQHEPQSPDDPGGKRAAGHETGERLEERGRQPSGTTVSGIGPNPDDSAGFSSWESWAAW